MKIYSITIKSNIDPNVGQISYFLSELNKGVLLDILTPITPYKLTISENDPGVIVLYGLEDVIKSLLETKLTTKVARNVIKIITEQLATFKEKPELNLNIWEGDSGEIRTYINNTHSVTIANVMFPGVFKMDMKSNKSYYPGKLILDHDSVANNYILTGIKSVDTVIYEEITLEK